MLMLMQAAPAAQAGGTAAFLIQMFPLLAIFVIFYLIVMRPQQRRVKEHRDSSAVKKGDEVVTNGGHVGRSPRSASMRPRSSSRRARQAGW